MNSFIQSSWKEQDQTFELPLRPGTLSDFFGQDKIKKRLEIFIGAALQREDALGHTLLSGPPGLGKTTMAHLIAKEMGTNIITSSGPVLEKPSDLAGILTNLQKGDIFFIDEIHRLSKSIEEYLYSAMEDFKLDLLIDTGPNARSVQIKLQPFTLIGATTRAGLLSSPLRSRFEFHGRLEYYPSEVLHKIITRSAKILKVSIDEKSTKMIGQRARGTPRILNNLLRWVRDYTQMKNSTNITLEWTKESLDLLGIDHKGLDELDKKVITIIIDHYNGGPVGVKTIAVAVGEEATTLEEMHEPYLILNGLLKRTPRGREATDLAYEHIGRKRLSNNQGDST